MSDIDEMQAGIMTVANDVVTRMRRGLDDGLPGLPIVLATTAAVLGPLVAEICELKGENPRSLSDGESVSLERRLAAVMFLLRLQEYAHKHADNKDTAIAVGGPEMQETLRLSEQDVEKMKAVGIFPFERLVN